MQRQPSVVPVLPQGGRPPLLALQDVGEGRYDRPSAGQQRIDQLARDPVTERRQAFEQLGRGGGGEVGHDRMSAPARLGARR